MEGMSKLDLNKQMGENPRVVAVVKEEEEFDGELQVDRKKKGGLKRSLSSSSSSGGGGGGAMRRCQADRCTADLSEEKQYHRKHKVCDLHSKSQVVLVSGLHQRFCQQCSRLTTDGVDLTPSCKGSTTFHQYDFISYQNSTTPKGVVAGVWQDTTNDEGRIQPSLMQLKAQAAMLVQGLSSRMYAGRSMTAEEFG